MNKTGTLADLINSDNSSDFFGNGILGMSDEEMQKLILEAYDRGIARSIAKKAGKLEETIDYGSDK